MMRAHIFLLTGAVVIVSRADGGAADHSGISLMPQKLFKAMHGHALGWQD